ncbi:Type IV pilus biogenesis protein PilE [hydrothermal vent metagenome]|uniref:Type IV pilus biogenesis protein PilE n=1 Tax=hydrothermal vent metagenome TaxID=652676 RepID=A0A3B0ZLF4_9ZZZZ
MNFKLTKKRSAGFSLIELMITVVIVGILGSIAFPSYINYVTEAKRSDGQVALMSSAQNLERCFTENNAYNHADCTFAATSPEGHYAITIARTTTIFTLTATPQASQTDPLCANLSLTNTGVQGKSGTGTVAQCW